MVSLVSPHAVGTARCANRLRKAVRSDANPDSKVKATYQIDKSTVLSLQGAPGSKDDLRLIEINTSKGKLEVLSASAADATAWMAVLQAERANKVGGSKRKKSQAEMDRGAVDELSTRKFIEVYMKKKAKDPLGLRLAGGTGVGSDPERPHIYVTYTRTGSRASKTDLRKGDIITHVNRRKFADLSVEEATDIINKASGNRVAIGLARSRNEPLKRQPHHDEGPPMEEEGGEKKRTSGDYGFSSPPKSPDGAAASGGEEEVFGFGNASESPPPKPEPVAELSADDEAAKKAARAEKLAKMKAARELKKQGSMVDLMDALAIIDNLPDN